MHTHGPLPSRRSLLRKIGLAGTGLLLSACTGASPSGAISTHRAQSSDFPPVPNSFGPELAGRDLALSTKIGQMLLLGFSGTRVDERSPIVQDILTYGVGGVVLFRHNVGWPLQVIELTTALQAASFQATGLPLFVAVDQEGGRVSRLTAQFGLKQNYSAQDLGALDDVERTAAYASNVAQSLKHVGINLNLAPVVDLNVNPTNPVIGALARSFSNDADVVSRHAAAFIRSHSAEGVLCTLKHFPGHGSSRQDSHDGFVDVTQTWHNDELSPYRSLIEQGHSDAVMTAHIFNANLDPQLPATLSPAVVTGILRGELGHQGLIFTDDLQMDAIRTYYHFEDAVRLAILAGVDVLSISNTLVWQGNAVALAVSVIQDMVESGTISASRIDDSYQRIVRAKDKLSLTLFASS